MAAVTLMSPRIRNDLRTAAALLLALVPPAVAVGAGSKIDPEMQQVLDAHTALGPRPVHTLTPAEARKGPTAKDAVAKVLKASGKPVVPEPVAQVEDRRIPSHAASIPARVYTPADAGNAVGPLPIVVYFHGGGFVLADLDAYDATPRAIANQAKAVVVSVHYRQAPESPYPAAADDAVAAFRYVQEHARDFNGDPARIAIAGESAGGNLATVVTMRQRNDNLPQPALQLLIYPFISNDLTTPSHRQNGQGNFLIANADLGWFWGQYLGNGWKETREALAVPIYASAAQLKGIAPALIITAALDPLADEGQQYAKKLNAAGVHAEVKSYPGVTHEFFGMAAVVDRAKQAQIDAGAALRKAFAARRPTAVGPTSVPGPAAAKEPAISGAMKVTPEQKAPAPLRPAREVESPR
jgi:acetyl esterase